MWDGEIAHTPRVPPFSVNNWWGNQLKLKPQHWGTAEEAKGGRRERAQVEYTLLFLLPSGKFSCQFRMQIHLIKAIWMQFYVFSIWVCVCVWCIKNALGSSAALIHAHTHSHTHTLALFPRLELWALPNDAFDKWKLHGAAQFSSVEGRNRPKTSLQLLMSQGTRQANTHTHTHSHRHTRGALKRLSGRAINIFMASTEVAARYALSLFIYQSREEKINKNTLLMHLK